MKVHEILQEYGLEIDDVRWYLASRTAERLMEYRENTRELVRLIWSGRLEDDLYHMEERFLEETQQKLVDHRMDEHHLRELVQDIRAARRTRDDGA